MNNSDIIVFCLQICVILISALICRNIAQKIGMPSVTGEIIAGIILGPTILGYFAPTLYKTIFIDSLFSISERNLIATFGILFFLFVTGLELDLTTFKQQKNIIIAISLLGMLIPLSLGVGMVLLFPNIWGNEIEDKNTLAIFIGVALSISALPVIARTLIDLKLLKTKIGMIILSVATINDLCGWMLFNVIINKVSIIPNNIFKFLMGITFILFLLSVSRLFLRKHSNSRFCVSDDLTGIFIIGILIASISMELIGFYVGFGAFLFGIVFSAGIDKENSNAFKIINNFTMAFLTPIYFVSIGLKINLANFDFTLVLLVTIIACLGKIIGTLIGAMLNNVSIKEALVIGFGMNARGVMEVIFSSLAFELKIIDQRIFIALIIMAIITTLISGPFMQIFLYKKSSDAAFEIPK